LKRDGRAKASFWIWSGAVAALRDVAPEGAPFDVIDMKGICSEPVLEALGGQQRVELVYIERLGKSFFSFVGARSQSIHRIPVREMRRW
jgi:hypothetical protein